MDPYRIAFDATFAFSRPIEADYVDAMGTLRTAAVNEPRRDYGPAGEPLGLLVERGPRLGFGDVCRARPGAWEAIDRATVVHAMVGASGQLTRRAFYTRTPRLAIDALLRQAGHHRLIGAVPGYLRNLGGFVRYRTLDWRLAPGLAIDAGGEPFADAQGRALIVG